jgi:peptidase E
MGGCDGFDDPLLRFAIDLAETARPRVLFVPTASADRPEGIVDFHELAAREDLRADHLRLWGVPDDPLGRVGRADVIVVCGGNTANMLAVWRVHGVDRALREAWERGAVLAGWSAGGNCWFQGCVTDSFSRDLDALADGLGLLAGSFCPHYDGEPRRRPVYERLVADGELLPGYACDDAAAVHFVGSELVEAVASARAARAWRVDGQRSTPLDMRLL